MINKTTSTNQDLPQLRQMVLENTERINKNEMMIKRMRMENLEQAKKISEHDELLENSRNDFDRQMQKIHDTLDRIALMDEKARIEHEKYFLDLKKQREESDRRIEENRKESDRRIEEHRKETDKQIKKHREETDRRIEESRKETDRQIKEMGKEIAEGFKKEQEQLRRMRIDFIGVVGNIVEGLVNSSTEKVFKEAGLDLHNSGKNVKRKLTAENKQMEIDVLLSGEKHVVPVEVKSKCTKEHVNRFLHQMELFRTLFPEHADKEVIAAIAALNYDDGADTLAHEEGLLVIRVSSEDIFSIDPFDHEKLRRF
jgi:hypothetical protein